MSDWPSRPDPEAELKEADILLQKADALLRRHKPSSGTPIAGGDDPDDLPVLTEIVPDTELAGEGAPSGARPFDENALVEHLIGLDAEIARALEAWFARELPQLVSRELDRLSERLLEEAIAHMRATLIPKLSNAVSNRLDKPASGEGS